ncbi:MAG: hypothetical protein EP349_07210 [Alphaproteobacteria bacterium]|nr:MAG: hypothetical protein EP349_07210 [Alphaproteobacteria bacterium]
MSQQYGDAAAAAPEKKATESFQTAQTADGGGKTFIHGEMTAIGKEAAEELHTRFKSEIAETVNGALPEGSDDALRKAATDYCIALVRTRQKMNQKTLKAAFEEGPEALQQKTKSLLSELDELAQELESQLESKRGSSEPDMSWFNAEEKKRAARQKTAVSEGKAQLDELFEGGERLYFKLSDYSSSPLLPYVREHVEAKGYTIKDYAAGYAEDNRKNTVKIGKILKDNPTLLKTYTEDPYRTADNLMVVLTRSYEDLARASFARGWQSCRSGSYSAVSNAISEINIGVVAAYLISDKDPDINNPLGRVNLKPYDSDPQQSEGATGWFQKLIAKKQEAGDDKTDTIYMTFNPIGLHHPGFVDAVNRFAEEHFNRGKVGKFSLRSGCESYQEFQNRTRLPEDTEEMLQAVGAHYKKNDDGSFTVKGDLSLRGLGISRLPDLTNVKVEGGIDISNNKLLSLEGLPQTPIKFLNASHNLLLCFAGCTPVIEGSFNYQDNAYLQTTLGKPQAAKYEYGNGRRDPGRRATSTECIGPLEKPESFPGFKRT